MPKNATNFQIVKSTISGKPDQSILIINNKKTYIIDDDTIEIVKNPLYNKFNNPDWLIDANDYLYIKFDKSYYYLFELISKNSSKAYNHYFKNNNIYDYSKDNIISKLKTIDLIETKLLIPQQYNNINLIHYRFNKNLQIPINSIWTVEKNNEKLGILHTNMDGDLNNHQLILLSLETDTPGNFPLIMS